MQVKGSKRVALVPYFESFHEQVNLMSHVFLVVMIGIIAIFRIFIFVFVVVVVVAVEKVCW